jgi:hypothetical protein
MAQKSRGNAMTNDEISGRLLVLETFIITTLALYVANASNDPTYEKLTAILNHLRGISKSLPEGTPVAVQTIAAAYSDHLATLVASNIRLLRGEAGQPH